MKTPATLLALIFTAALTLPVFAQQTPAGTWTVQSVSEVQPPKGVSLTLTFGSESKATLTYDLSGQEPQRWSFNYNLTGNTVSLNAINPMAQPRPVNYEFRFEGDLMMLYPPKPEDDGDPATPEPADNRKPIWVLKRS